MPLLCVAEVRGEGLILSAVVSTAGLFALLTITIFITRMDLSFMRPFLTFIGLAALGAIVLSMLGLVTLPMLFVYAMIAFVCCVILFQTSNVLHHYRIGQHVAASLALLASVVMLFWYVLQLFMSRD